MSFLVTFEFFPHNRGDVIKQMAALGELDAIFVNDAEGYVGIKPYRFLAKRFLHAPCRRLGHLTVQLKAVTRAAFARLDAAVLNAKTADGQYRPAPAGWPKAIQWANWLA